MMAQPVDIQVPIIDLAGCHDAPSPEIVETIAQAAEEFGFFQIVNHGITDAQIAEVWKATRAFFALPLETKREILRTKENSRGYYDRELTKNARDLKEVLDIAQVPFPELADDAPPEFPFCGRRESVARAHRLPVRRVWATPLGCPSARLSPLPGHGHPLSWLQCGRDRVGRGQPPDPAHSQ